MGRAIEISRRSEWHYGVARRRITYSSEVTGLQRSTLLRKVGHFRCNNIVPGTIEPRTQWNRYPCMEKSIRNPTLQVQRSKTQYWQVFRLYRSQTFKPPLRKLQQRFWVFTKGLIVIRNGRNHWNQRIRNKKRKHSHLTQRHCTQAAARTRGLIKEKKT